MFSFLSFVVFLSILIIVHEFGHFIFAKRMGVKVERFSLGFGKKIIGFKKGETEYCICAIPLGGYIKMAGETPYESRSGAKWEFLSKPIHKRALIIFAGPALNYFLAFLVFIAVFLMGNPQMTSDIGAVMEDYPAQEAGIQKGDKIIALDGKPIAYWEEVLKLIHEKTEGSVDVKVQRGSATFDYKLVPQVKSTKNIFGQDVRIGLIGIAPSEKIEFVKYGIVSSINLSASRVWGLTKITYMGLWRIITGGMSVKESVTGPIGIYMITSKAARLGFVYVLQVLAVVSTCLAIFNLLPIPILDGGHIVFLALEKMRKKPLSPKVYEGISNVSMFLLILLMVFVFYNDFNRMEILDKIARWWQQK